MSEYKVLTYVDGARTRAGVLVDGKVFDLAALTGDEADSSVLALLQQPHAAEKLNRAAAQAQSSADGRLVEQVKLAAPILYPSAIYCTGANYGDHVREMAEVMNRPVGPDPRTSGLTSWFFLKPPRATVIADHSTVHLPPRSKAVDWEAEMAAVIGRPARNVSVAEALDYVFGYTVANDLSARDLMRRPPLTDASPFYNDWVAHKAFDGSCPLGPWIVPATQIRDPQDLGIGLRLNGVVKQDSNTREMIFNIAEQIAHASALRTLYPGDLVLTGTPAGVGAARREFLKPGDQIEAWVEGIGTLHTTIAEPI